MAIERQFFSLIMQVKQHLAVSRKSISALFLAYPDILMAQRELSDAVGQDILNVTPCRADAKSIWQWHGMNDRDDPIFDSMALFKNLGFDAHIIDIVAARGCEEIVDLNNPLPAHLCERFDLVVDTGTCEHCFNVGQAFANACCAVASGGFLIHAAPMSRTNHGFWNFCPTVYPDFFEDNGFKVHMLSGMTADLRNGFKPFPVSIGRFSPPPESILFVVAERTSIRPTRWPMQRKYR